MRMRSAGLLCVALAACTPSRKELGNVYRVPIITNLKSFDPVQCQDQYSNVCQQQVYETLYQYKYLARPYDVEPLLAAAPPEVSDSGKTYRIRLRRGVRFVDDPCFPGGKGREVKAEDFVYSVKRLADQRNKTTGWWIYEGKIVGLDEFRAAGDSLPPLSDSTYHPALYDRAVEGLSALDDTTLQIKLTKPYPYFKYILAMQYAAVVAHEAVDYYREDFMNHPVGTGPFILTEWRRGLRLRFARNPGYHHGFYPSEGTRDDSARGLLADAGRPLPFIDRLDIDIFEEGQPMWLNFLRGNLDYSTIPKDNFGQVVTPQKTLKGDYAGKGLSLIPKEELDLTYVAFNMEDPVLGKNKKLRQAMSLASNVEETIQLFYNNQAMHARSPIPPGLFGYDSTFVNPNARYDLEAAKQKLTEAGFPGGKGLPEFEYLTQTSTASRQMVEQFIQHMARIGVRVRLEAVTWPEFLDRLKKKKIQLAGAAWGADYPDPENFLQLLYGPNESPGENNANFKNAEYDSLYLKMAVMQDTPERKAIIDRMKNIVADECPWILETHRLRQELKYDWTNNFKPSAVIDMPAKYIRIDDALRQSRLER
jgi:oligopeptide transport system substrate-binding protein